MWEQVKHRLFTIWEAHEPMNDVLVPLHYLVTHFPEHKLMPALEWLIQNRITGRRFVAWFSGDCASSHLEMHRHLIARLDHSPTRALFIDDFRKAVHQ